MKRVDYTDVVASAPAGEIQVLYLFRCGGCEATALYTMAVHDGRASYPSDLPDGWHFERQGPPKYVDALLCGNCRLVHPSHDD